jgi:hypothetical protein
MLASDLALKTLVDQWSACTLSEKEFNHAAHVAVCSYIVWHHSLPDSYSRMRAGLYRFNEAVGTPNSDERGYHETLTRFWCTLLFYRIHQGQFSSSWQAANRMLSLYQNDSRAERHYYSFDVLKSKEARRTWLVPDVPGPIPLAAFHW